MCGDIYRKENQVYIGNIGQESNQKTTTVQYVLMREDKFGGEGEILLLLGIYTYDIKTIIP